MAVLEKLLSLITLMYGYYFGSLQR